MGERRISPVDTIWLNMDRPNNLMVIDALVLFEAEVDWDRVRAVFRERVIDAFPVFRQRPAHGRTPLNQPRWRDDPEFRLNRHIRRANLPGPGDDAELREFVQRRMSEPLDRDHPLWQVHFIDGYRNGAALLVRLHHCIADGIALTRLLLSLTDEEPDAQPEPPKAGRARRDGWPPGIVGNAARALTGTVTSAVSVASDRVTTLARRAGPRLVGDVAVQAGRTVQIVDKLLLGRDPPNILVGEPGREKLAAWSRPFPLDEIRHAGRLAGATVNDVLMSMVAGSISTYLIEHGQAPVDLSTMVPVYVGPLDVSLTELGNRFALVFVKLPVSVREPLARLVETKTRMDAIKHSVEARLTFTLITVFGHLSPLLERRLVDFFAAKAIGVTTDVAGPHAARYLGGAKIAGILAWVPTSGRQAVGICLVTYDNTVRVGFKVDAATIRDPEQLVSAFDRQVESLLRMAAVA